MATNKETYTRRGRELATSMAQLTEHLTAWRNTYWDRTYNDSGADEIVDADVEGMGVTAADVTGLTTFADALDTFMASNRPYLSNMRQDM